MAIQRHGRVERAVAVGACCVGVMTFLGRAVDVLSAIRSGAAPGWVDVIRGRGAPIDRSAICYSPTDNVSPVYEFTKVFCCSSVDIGVMNDEQHFLRCRQISPADSTCVGNKVDARLPYRVALTPGTLYVALD
jgi:hypothetical protein